MEMMRKFGVAHLVPQPTQALNGDGGTIGLSRLDLATGTGTSGGGDLEPASGNTGAI